MSKINNSYLDFTKQYRNLREKPVLEAYDRIDNPTTKFDNFLKTSTFSKRLEKPSQNQSELQSKKRGPTKSDYFFIEHNPRFKEDQNCNQKIFGQKQTQFHSDIIENIRNDFKQKNYSFHYQPDKLDYSKDQGLPIQPKERVKELQLVKKEQELHRSLRQDANFLNRKKRILENLHKSETLTQNKHRNISYDKYRNQNESLEFNNSNTIIGDKMNLSFHLSKDWKCKKRSETSRLDTFERILSLQPTNIKVNIERMNYLKFRENCGRDYKIVNLTKDE
ncbi:unnamed protein product (macronuclear) [Paramecium tetraurelia]|uniref:Uncharacterized protein n=1 Tax=Paramecium tetraurelia TaxID=5888 RepID=A0DFE1_PARTE|nr:uncharacterized protein GSPATT00016571001 [Paramecium tetraurelia]CAK81758.1 unnamed protein product [Paramecium tetraurelia]|eukprot:XP_001449155.1 hypothetical protein (macronuclear) [Paramecium tetraurelia strain d4-2]